MSNLINPATFQPTEDADGHHVRGTVEVTIAGETRRVPALKSFGHVESPHLNGITAYGITGRYRTGKKAWPGYVTRRDSGMEYTQFGFDSRSGKHHKATISFAP